MPAKSFALLGAPAPARHDAAIDPRTDSRAQGTIRFDGRDVDTSSTQRSRAGVAWVPEERARRAEPDGQAQPVDRREAHQVPALDDRRML